MNSLVQQLYHIPAFSSGLLSISSDQNNENSMSNLNGSFDACDTALNRDKDKDRDNNNSMISSSHSYGISVDNDVGVEVEAENNTLSAIKAAPTDDEKFLFQLQVMFGYLRLSEKRFYDTMSFCKVRKCCNAFIVSSFSIIVCVVMMCVVYESCYECCVSYRLTYLICSDPYIKQMTISVIYCHADSTHHCTLIPINIFNY